MRSVGRLVSHSATGYDLTGNLAWEEAANGVKTVYYYTPEGDLSYSALDLDGDLNTLDDQYATEKAVYDEYGRQIQSIFDTDGDWSTIGDQTVTKYIYDSQGNLSGTIYADGTSVSVSYDESGRKLSETDRLGRTTYYEYNQNGWLTAVILPRAKHPVTGEMVHVRYEYGYNHMGAQTSLRDNIYQTDPLDKNTINRDGQRETSFEFDSRGRQTARTLPDGSTEHFFYDAQGRRQKHISFEGRVTYYEYDQSDRLARITFFNSQSDFDRGRAAQAISYTYNVWDELIKEVDTVNGATTAEYDRDGNLARLSTPQGTINYEYDQLTGQVSRTWTGNDSAKPITDVRNTYDRLGRLETVSTYAREGSFLATPETARYVYDLIGNLDKLIQANGVIADYEYDQLNRLKELTHYAPDDTPEDLSDNEILQRYTYDYFNDGNKSQETFLDAEGRGHTWAWTYDQLGRLVREVHDNADDDLDYTTEYTYDLVGNRLVKKTDKLNDGTVDEEIRSTFDQNDRLKSELELIDGTETRRTDYVYQQTEQIAKEIIDLVNKRLESKTTMEYNAQGRLSKLVIDTFENGVKSNSVSQEYFYDSTGIKVRQVEKVDDNADGIFDAESETSYLVDALNHTGYEQVLEERLVEDGREVKVTTYTIGHDVLSQYDGVNGYLGLLADGHGSTRAVAGLDGLVKQQYNYDAYGNAHGFDPKQALTNLLYSGEQYNPVSGLQYLRARWYSPQSGRFNRLDPFSGDRQSPLSYHKYAYAHMNPVAYSDPTGKSILMMIVTVANIGLSVTFGINTLLNAHLTATSIVHIIESAKILIKSAEHDPIGTLTMMRLLIAESIEEFQKGLYETANNLHYIVLGSALRGAAANAARAVAAKALTKANTLIELAENKLGHYRNSKWHHILSQAAFGQNDYNKYSAPSISKKRLEELGINHRKISDQQLHIFARMRTVGKPINMRILKAAEYKCLVEAGVDKGLARQWVDAAALYHDEIGFQPTRIPGSKR